VIAVLAVEPHPAPRVKSPATNVVAWLTSNRFNVTVAAVAVPVRVGDAVGAIPVVNAVVIVVQVGARAVLKAVTT
jgi:hypothetical protein